MEFFQPHLNCPKSGSYKYDDLTEVAKLFNMYKGPPQGISEDLFNPHTA